MIPLLVSTRRQWTYAVATDTLQWLIWDLHGAVRACIPRLAPAPSAVAHPLTGAVVLAAWLPAMVPRHASVGKGAVLSLEWRETFTDTGRNGILLV